jgi:hypothetical protein
MLSGGFEDRIQDKGGNALVSDEKAVMFGGEFHDKHFGSLLSFKLDTGSFMIACFDDMLDTYMYPSGHVKRHIVPHSHALLWIIGLGLV